MAAALLLTNCTIGSVKTDYKIAGAESDEKTQSYLHEILEERLQEKTKTFKKDEKDTDLQARQENYLEQTIRAELLKALHARGYYGAAVNFADGQAPLSGRYDIDYGTQYTIAKLTVTPAEYATHLPDTLAEGTPLNAASVLTAQALLRDSIGKDRCYFDLSVENAVRLNNTSSTGDVALNVTAEREGNFGGTSFEGNGSVKESHLRRLLPWKEGDCFRREKLEEYKTALMQSGLFSRAEIVLPEDGPNADGHVPVTLSLKERAHRTIGAGLTYYSDEGPGATASWEHRNFLGAAEKFKALLNISALKQSIEAALDKPFFFRKDQNLSLNAALRRQDTDAFEEFALNTGASVTRKFDKHLSFTTGIETSLLRINDHTLNTKETFGLLSAPQTLAYDTRDNTLDPRKGINLSINVEPFVDLFGQADPFFKTYFSGSGYLAFGKDGDTVLAARGGIGTIWGADMNAIPATERFYAGGGGSVRGYGYQEVGPKSGGDPTGGRSVATTSVELRTKFSERLGGVAFVDAGSVSEESAPTFDQPAVGVGVGVRYYTSFAPIRFDIAVPLTQKDDTDQSFQFYISIGQAF